MSKLRLKSRISLITGGSGGFGIATCERFIEEGSTVILADINEQKLNDLTTESQKRVDRLKPGSVEEVRALGEPLIAFSDTLGGEIKELRRFLMERMYRHYKVNRKRSQAKRILKELFALFLSEPDTLPPPWSEQAQQATRDGRARMICDYIAGMTDNYAIDEHRRLFNLDAMI